MTTPQPKPTDDLEAVARIIRETIDCDYDGTVFGHNEAASAILKHLRPAGVGEFTANDIAHLIETQADVEGDRLHNASQMAQAIYTRMATPAHPDDALVERVRTAIDEAFTAGAMSVHEYWTDNPGEAPSGDPEFGEASGDHANAAIDALLSDLKAGAGR